MKNSKLLEVKETITHVTGEGNYCWVFTSDGKKHLSSVTLKNWAEWLPDFLRIHKQNLVNPAYIEEFELDVDSNFKILNLIVKGHTLAVARRSRTMALFNQVAQSVYPTTAHHEPVAEPAF